MQNVSALKLNTPPKLEGRDLLCTQQSKESKWKLTPSSLCRKKSKGMDEGGRGVMKHVHEFLNNEAVLWESSVFGCIQAVKKF